jgi:opacity protein-like surface antigen
MRTSVACALLAMALALSVQAPASAQIPGVRLGFAGGPSFPMGDLADVATTGYHLRGSLGLELPLIPLGVRGDLVWQQFPADVDGNYTGLTGLLNATWRLPVPIVKPYLIGGAGFLNYDEPDRTIDGQAVQGESGSNFAWAAGAGVQLRLLRLGGFVEARYLDWGRHRAIPLTFGVTF